MRSRSRRTLDGLLVIGPHPLADQLLALTAYARRTSHSLEVFWAILPEEDPAMAAPDSGFPIVAFDDEIAGFTAEEYRWSESAEDAKGKPATDWHVAHATPQPKQPTTHLPVYGFAAKGETAADAILCVGAESLDRQLARIEAYAIRSALRLGGVYVANNRDNLRVLLRDFLASNHALATGPTLTVGPGNEIEVHE